jgi:hypothetical protein
MAFHAAFQRVQAAAGKVHILRLAGPVQGGEDTPYLAYILCGNPALVVPFKQPSQSTMFKSLNRGCNV